jgi:hypothetical protein
LKNTFVDVLRYSIVKPSFSAASLHTEILFQLELNEEKKGREGILREWVVTSIHWINKRTTGRPEYQAKRAATICHAKS